MRIAEAAALLQHFMKESKADSKELMAALIAIQDDALEAAAWIAAKRSKGIAIDIRAMKSKGRE